MSIIFVTLLWKNIGILVAYDFTAMMPIIWNGMSMIVIPATIMTTLISRTVPILFFVLGLVIVENPEQLESVIDEFVP